MSDRFPKGDIVVCVGRNGVIGAAFETVYAGNIVYPWLAAKDTIDVVSSAVADDGAPAGTGALTVRLTGVDDVGAAATEDYILNGTTPVAGAVEFFRVNRAEVLTVGTGGKNAGVITFTDNGGSAVQMIIPIGENVGEGAFYTVPAGKRAVVRKVWACNTAASVVEFGLFIRENGGVIKRSLKFAVNGEPLVYEPIQPVTAGALADIELMAKDAATGGILDAGFELWVGNA